jgi:acetolactate synthase-1/3 small subunit
MTFVAEGDTRDMRQVQTQLYKLINVTAVQDVTDVPTVDRELALIKVKASNGSRAEVMQLVDIYRASIIDVDMETVIIQAVGSEGRVNSLVELLSSFGIVEMVRTGKVAMVRGSHDRAAEQKTAVSAYKNGHS